MIKNAHAGMPMEQQQVYIPPPPKESDNTVLYVTGGIVPIVVALIGYWAAKKMRK